jgi:hypothetical protein
VPLCHQLQLDRSRLGNVRGLSVTFS